MARIRIYDATATEGVRGAGVQLSVRDKLRVVLRLAEMGAAFVEGGWPGGRSGNADVLRQARRLDMGGARLCACASLAPRGRGAGRAELQAAIRSGAAAVTLLVPGAGAGGRGAAQVRAAVAEVRRAGRVAVVDLGDYFDLTRRGQPLAASVEAAADAGAEAILLSDTSGGALPHEIAAGVAAARRSAGRAAVGVRARNDAGVAVANTLAAVGAGATVVAGTVNGYGERCGAADLVPVVAALELKLGHQALSPGQLRRLTSLAHFVAELADRDPARDQPYAGRDAFARGQDGAAPHVDPEAVGNRAESAMADERGHPGALRAARALGLPARGEVDARRVLRRLAEWERRGFRYEGAEASFELLLREVAGRRREYFRVLAYRVLDLHRGSDASTEATVEVAVGRARHHSAAMGVGPVHALDRALRVALEQHYPELADLQLVESRSRNLGSAVGTAGAVRLQIESADGRARWGTAGVSDNLLDACRQALVDAIEYKLVKDDVAPRTRRG